MSNWRTGRKVPLNVYEGNRAVCQCHTPEDAARIVVAMKALENTALLMAEEPVEPSAETAETLRNIQTEIGAGMVLLPKTDPEHAWNNAHTRANQIISGYRQGLGLFQMNRRAEQRQESTPEEPTTT